MIKCKYLINEVEEKNVIERKNEIKYKNRKDNALICDKI